MGQSVAMPLFDADSVGFAVVLLSQKYLSWPSFQSGSSVHASEAREGPYKSQ